MRYIEDPFAPEFATFLPVDAGRYNKISVGNSVVLTESDKGNINKINEAIIEINDLKLSLPDSNTKVERVKTLIKNIRDCCDKIEDSGLDEDISNFLAEVREGGFALDRLLSNKKILKWLKENDQSSSFKVKRYI